jgi:4-oxalocrotonate tautomerase family enzyme
MAQIKIYGVRTHLKGKRQLISDTIHSCVVDVLQLPPEKRFHRFIALDQADFIYPDDRSDQYIIIEIVMFEGRSVEVKKNLIRLLFERLKERTGIYPQDVEIAIFEMPRSNWGIRGLPGDELEVNYKIELS